MGHFLNRICVVATTLLSTLALHAQNSTSATIERASTETTVGKSREPAALVPVAKGGKFLTRHASFIKRGKEAPIDVLFLGDSITERWETSGSKVWDKHYSTLKAANFGIGGDRTQHILWRIENGELDGISARVLVLMIGTNNSNTDEATDIAAGVKRIMQQIGTRLPSTKVLLLGIFPRNAKRDLPSNVPMQRVTAANKELAKMDNGNTIRYLDISEKFLQNEKVPADIMPDGVHLTEKGYEIWAEAIDPLLKEMLKD